MQPQLSHQAMGYDRTSTMFSPDGRLLQVEYAKKTVKQGTSTIGVVCKDGVVLVADKRVVEKLIVPNSVEKIFQIDAHIGAAASGIVSDGRILVERAQIVAQQHRVTYDSPIDVQSIVRDICDLKQNFTQWGGARPFGVSLLFGGVDDFGENGSPRLFLTDPTGIFFEYKATAIGEYDSEIKEILENEYKENMSVQDGIRLAVRTLKKVLGKDFDIDRLDGAGVMIKEKKFFKISKEMFSKAK
ncbi:MAG: archaeal proteasome endopeptidase complex subunit alpha [Nanoarchaeota archaeon]